MHDATVDRFAKIITPDENSGKNRRVQQTRGILGHLYLAEGWFSFVLLALVVYSTIWCFQAVNWVDHLNLITPLTPLGLIFGIVPPNQRRFPRFLVLTF